MFDLRGREGKGDKSEEDGGVGGEGDKFGVVSVENTKLFTDCRTQKSGCFQSVSAGSEMLEIDRDGFIVLVFGVVIDQHDLGNFLVFGGYRGNPGTVTTGENLGSGQSI